MRFTDKNDSGFTIIEIGMVMIVAAAILTGIIKILLPMVELSRQVETEEKLLKISQYLNAYAVQNYRFPCPAEPNNIVATANGEPYGFEAGSGANGDTPFAAGQTCPFNEGIVPFETLGMTEDLVVDGWDNHITYAINPNFAQDTLGIAGGAIPAAIHPACRTRDWMYENGVDATGEPALQNKNPKKARFCCPDLSAGPDLFVFDEGVDPTNPADDINVLNPNDRNANAPSDGYLAVDTLMRPINPATSLPVNESDVNYFTFPQVPPATERSTAVGYILISHGQNELGAFIPSTGARSTLLPPGGSVESENTDGDNIYTDQQTFSLNVATFDDMIIWRTQDLAFAAEGETCAMP